MIDTTITITTVIGILIACLVIGLVNIINTERDKHREEMAAKDAELERYKKSQNTAQRATIKGQLAEQLWPLSSICEFSPSDMKFLGMPVDYIVFDGYTECKDNEYDYINQIIFVDIKSGNAQLSRHQRLIKDAVENGRISWQTIRV